MENMKNNYDAVETWGRIEKAKYSDRVKKGVERVLNTRPGFDLERAYAEMKAYIEYKDEPRVIQRARAFERFLLDKTIRIEPDELIVGNVADRVKGAPFFGEYYYQFVKDEMDDPVKDFEKRGFDEFIVTPEQRKELREEILPFFANRCLQRHVFDNLMDEETRNKTVAFEGIYPTTPVCGGLMVQTDCGHTVVNYPKVLKYGLKAIKEDVIYHKKQTEEMYCFDRKAKLAEYEAMIISLDAAMAYSQRYADLARRLAEQEADEVRKAELLEIARVCEKVPAEPADSFREAVQCIAFIHILCWCEVLNVSLSFGRVDQYLYPYYKKSVLDLKEITEEEAIELLHMWFIKTNEHTELYNYDNAQTQMGYQLGIQMTVGGQTQDGKDAVNELSFTLIEAERNLGLQNPDFGVRVFDGSNREFIKRVAEVIRLGRGKPKYFFDNKALECLSKEYPDLPIEELRDYITVGCTELILPFSSQPNTFVALINVPKVVELTLKNGKCGITGQQLGPETGDARKFMSMGEFRKAFEKQLRYWTEFACKSVKIQMDAQAEFSYSPFNSALMEGPIQKGKDMCEGGAWYTAYTLWFPGLATAADALTSIDKLVFRDKKASWEQLLEALDADWEGYETLLAYDINQVPKYGNDIDFADDNACYIMDVWNDIVDEINLHKEMLPKQGGKYITSTIVGTPPTGMGQGVMALPGGHRKHQALSDTSSPVHGMDTHGPAASVRSNAKLPQQRMSMGNCMNQRLSPKMMATDEDIEIFTDYIMAINDNPVAEIQFNVISSSILKKAMADPNSYRDLLVRVASYQAYFVTMNEECQMDIINRTEYQEW